MYFELNFPSIKRENDAHPLGRKSQHIHTPTPIYTTIHKYTLIFYATKHKNKIYVRISMGFLLFKLPNISNKFQR